MTCTYFRIIIHSTAYHHLQITWLSYFGSENQGLPLRSWFVTCWLWRHIPIVTSLAVPSSCVVTQTPMGTNSGTRRRKRKFLLLFVNCDRGRIEIDHLYGLCCRGWYCNPEQHSLCRPARPQAAARRPAQLVLFRIAVPTTPAQTLSWSIPITIIGSDNGLSLGRHQAITWTNVGILLIRPLGRSFSEMLIEIHTFSIKKIHLKMSGKWRPFCLGLNVLNVYQVKNKIYSCIKDVNDYWACMHT